MTLSSELANLADAVRSASNMADKLTISEMASTVSGLITSDNLVFKSLIYDSRDTIFKPNPDKMDFGNGNNYDNNFTYTAGIQMQQGHKYLVRAQTNGSNFIDSNGHEYDLVTGSQNAGIWLIGGANSSYYPLQEISDLSTNKGGTIFTWNDQSCERDLRINVYDGNAHKVEVWGVVIYEIEIK